MTWALVWTRPALKDMKKIDRSIARRVREAVIELAETGHGDVAKLKDTNPPEWRLRVGDRRVLFRFRSDLREIHLLRVLRRDRAY
ncbi:MAG: type II toxin-antitoxin system RelE/ParE family toxin [Rhodospirillaceae bacterium]|nr:type II toxin-antitoxin system RelE/ParE family toxin [Rhodospirillaceae bacterium]